jgi:hypothetical protein
MACNLFIQENNQREDNGDEILVVWVAPAEEDSGTRSPSSNMSKLSSGRTMLHVISQYKIGLNYWLNYM